MNINNLKHFIGRMRCIGNRVAWQSGIYIGKHCNIKEGRNIHLGKDVSIRPFCDIFASCDGVKIGDNCDIGTRNRIAGKVIMESNVLTGPDVFICSYDHEYRDPSKAIIEQKEYTPCRNGHNCLIIGNGSWIGIHSVISGDVHIGKHCVIGANSVVTEDIPDYCVAVGAPAKVVKRYNFESKVWERV